MRIDEFFKQDNEKVEKLLEQYPVNIPTRVVADFLKIDVNSVRAIIECGNVGLSWRKTGKMNTSYVIPTATFLRWYLNKK